MSSKWRYGLAKKTVPDGQGGTETVYGVVEVYMNSDGSLNGHSDFIDANNYDSPEIVIKQLLNMARDCFDNPGVIDLGVVESLSITPL